MLKDHEDKSTIRQYTITITVLTQRHYEWSFDI